MVTQFPNEIQETLDADTRESDGTLVLDEDPTLSREVCQGRRSLRSEMVDLGVRLAGRVPGGFDYRCRLSDTGAESMDSVLEEAFSRRLAELQAIHEEIREEVSKLWLEALSAGGIDVPGGRELSVFLDDLEERNMGALESFARRPVVFAFDGESTAGTGLAAGSPRWRRNSSGSGELGPDMRVVLLEPDSPERLVRALEVHKCHFLVPRLYGKRLQVEVRKASLVFALVIEGFRDGSGTTKLSESTMEWLSGHREGLPIVIEETLIGCGGEGRLFGFERTALRDSRPEYIVLNKLFAGWGAKIGAALVRDDLACLEDGAIVEGFAEDDFSLEVALAVFDALDAADRKVRDGVALGQER